MKKDTAGVIRKALPLFLLIFTVLVTVLGSGSILIYRSASNNYIAGLQAQESRAVDLENTAILAELQNVASDARFLAGQNELVRFLDTGNVGLLPKIENEYLRMAAVKPAYDQIRFLDYEGMEIVRVNNDGEPVPVPADKLQNKTSHYYFTNAFALDKDTIYTSPLDLNVENGLVEFPMKPMIRVGTPLFDSRGIKRGVMMINYKAAGLLDMIADAGKVSLGEKMLVNSDGYWLLGPTGERVWGFMFKDLQEETFALEYPEEWRAIIAEGSGQFVTGNGLFTFTTLHPLQKGQHASHGDDEHGTGSSTIESKHYFWVLLSRIPSETLRAHGNKLASQLLLAGGALFLFMLGGGGHLSLAITRRREYQAKLVTWAQYDGLTGLANRKLFFDRLAADMSQAKRHERRLAILYIDMDGFKAVNDTHGHEAGDDLLIQVGGRMQAIVRKSDTVARLGGDEFAIILAEIGSADGAFRVGEKIVDELSRPFTLKRAEVNVGASIGVAVFPDHATSEETLVQGADKAMYASKAKGKNCCTSMDDLED